MRSLLYVFLLSLLLVAVISAPASAQGVRWLVGGNLGLSVGEGNAGFHLGPMAEALFERKYAVGAELNINTQAGTPIELPIYFKYYFKIRGSTPADPISASGLAVVSVFRLPKISMPRRTFSSVRYSRPATRFSTSS